MQDLEGRGGSPYRHLLSSAGKHDHEVGHLFNLFHHPVIHFSDAKMLGTRHPFSPVCSGRVDVALEATDIIVVIP